MVERVQQEDRFGCQIAVGAMILGISYAAAKAIFPANTCERGVTHHVLDDILANRGIGVARKFKFSAEAGAHRSPWPPAPWAALHWCQVLTNGCAHAVVMLADGSVLDPASPAPRRLTDYDDVHMVAAVMR